MKNRDLITGRYIKTHGEKQTRLYGIWCGMKSRCNNKKYLEYGGKGVSVCEEWNKDFLAFKEWAIANGYSDELTIDRIDGDGNYCPDNCRWATYSEQNRNYGRNILLEYEGETMCLKDMAERHGLNPSTVRFRLNSGKSIQEAVSPMDGRNTRRGKDRRIAK